MSQYSFRIASGSGVGLASLANVEEISQIARPPRCTAVNPFPVEAEAWSGAVVGQGRVRHVWIFDALPYTGLDYILTTYLTTSGSLVKSKAVTIYTLKRRLFGADTYQRYNAYLVLPVPGQDYEDGGTFALNLNLRFTNLREI